MKEVRLSPHKHCIVCGKAIQEGQEFCSARCRQSYERKEKRYRTTTRISYILFIILLLIFMLTFLKM